MGAEPSKNAYKRIGLKILDGKQGQTLLVSESKSTKVRKDNASLKVMFAQFRVA
jgi:hypothetical protein